LYDHSQPLVIDPVLVYSTYLGGSDYDVGQGIAVNSAGNAYVIGYTASTDFPTMNPMQPASGGPPDAFVAKLNPTGSALIYSTYLGGSQYGVGQGIAVNSAGNAYVTGTTASTDFPTMNPLQPAIGGGGGSTDAFVTKLSPSGSALVYSTYLGGSGADSGYGIAVDSAGNAYVTGLTGSTNFPTMNPFQETFGGGSLDAFVSKLSFSLPFSCFSCRLELHRDEQDFDLDATFTLGPGGSINPLTEPVSLTIGTYLVTIPAGSFVEHDGGYRFEGVINGVRLVVLIKHGHRDGDEYHSDIEAPQDDGSARCAREADSYKFLAEGRGANLKGTTNPVTVTISVGGNTGATRIKAKLEQPWVGY
jgi:Beta-propeller repeat